MFTARPAPTRERGERENESDDIRPGREDGADERHADGDRHRERPPTLGGKVVTAVRNRVERGGDEILASVGAQAGRDLELRRVPPERMASFHDRDVMKGPPRGR